MYNIESAKTCAMKLKTSASFKGMNEWMDTCTKGVYKANS